MVIWVNNATILANTIASLACYADCTLITKITAKKFVKGKPFCLLSLLIYNIWEHTYHLYRCSTIRLLQYEQTFVNAIFLHCSDRQLKHTKIEIQKTLKGPAVVIKNSTLHVNLLQSFISVINQLYTQNFCFTVSLFHASTCFEHHVLIIRRS